MDNRVKLLVIGLGVLAVLCLAIAGKLLVDNNTLKDRNIAIDEELNRIKEERKELTANLSSAKSKNTSLSNSLQEAQLQLFYLESWNLC